MERAQEYSHNAFFAENLYAVYRVGEINEKIVGMDSLDLAPGTWHSAMRLSTRANNFERIDYCLLMKTPFDLDPGQARFVRAMNFSAPCSDYLFAPAASNTLDFYNAVVDLEDSVLTIKLDKETHRYSFINLSGLDVQVSPEDGASKAHRETLKAGEICLAVADDCSVSKDRCGECEGGSHYIKNSACASAYSKVCGRDLCGQKGYYACLRGHASTGIKDYCIQDSPVGFCSGDNRVGCVNGTLVCE